jgi:Protein of unknown function (DUF2799)
MKSLQTISLILFSALMGGCVTMNKDDCLTADWNAIGKKDAEKGKSTSGLSKYAQWCGKHGIQPDRSSYRKGHQEGAIVYCTTDNGFIEGKKNKTYHGICPSEMEVAFKGGYAIGQKYYAVLSEIRTLRYSLQSASKKVEELIEDNEDLQNEVYGGNISSERKKEIIKVHSKNKARVKTLFLESQYLRENLAVKKYQHEELIRIYGYQ